MEAQRLISQSHERASIEAFDEADWSVFAENDDEIDAIEASEEGRAVEFAVEWALVTFEALTSRWH